MKSSIRPQYMSLHNLLLEYRDELSYKISPIRDLVTFRIEEKTQIKEKDFKKTWPEYFI